MASVLGYRTWFGGFGVMLLISACQLPDANKLIHLDASIPVPGEKHDAGGASDDDAGTPPNTVVDAGATPEDAAAPEDAATSDSDAGSTMLDASTPEQDAGTPPESDAGQTQQDAGTPDAGGTLPGPCASAPCVHGTCSELGSDYACDCEPGYVGANCAQNFDDCTATACLNGGSCIDQVNGYSCQCAPGFSGDHCETCPANTTCDSDPDDCAVNPCLNGGSCTDGVNSFTCSCPAGYSGTRCETNINECVGNQCKNGSTCVDGIASYSCTCLAGYTDTYCQTNIDDCAAQPCQNGGACTDGVNSYTCKCATGFTGKNCETNINDCASNQCKNGSTCVDGIASYSCSCLNGYTGTYCQTNINDCSPSPCLNGASCTDGVASYTCKCVAGYTGTQCETNIDDCAASPCQNGGTCTDGVNAFSCTCPMGWKGSTCSEVAGPCDYHPCSNDGVCIPADNASGYLCACENGFTGTECQTVSAATDCSNLWSSVQTFYGNAVTLGSCEDYPAARTIVASLMNLDGLSVKIASSNYKPCVDFRCDASYVYVVSTNLPSYDPPSWLPGSQSSPPSTNLIFRIPTSTSSIANPSPSQVGDATTLGANCDDAYQYFVGITSTEVAQEPYGFCAMNQNGTRYFKDGNTYYRRTNCLTGNGVVINGEQIYGSNEAKNGSWGNPAFYYPDLGTSTESYNKSSTGVSRPALDFCGTHFHHHGINAACYEQDSDRSPLHTSYTNADVRGLFDFAKWIYDDTCSDESEIVGWMPDGVPIKGPCVCMERAADGTCIDARHTRSSYVYQGINSWKGSASSSSTTATDLNSHEGKACSADSDCGTSGNLECTWSVFSDDTDATGTTVAKRCVITKYAWCSHNYVSRGGVDTSASGIQYLDRCNGVTSADGYAYHTTGSFPYVPSCMKYEPSDSIKDSTL